MNIDDMKVNIVVLSEDKLRQLIREEVANALEGCEPSVVDITPSLEELQQSVEEYNRLTNTERSHADLRFSRDSGDPT